MNAELAYVDSSALAKWDPNESGSAEFVAFIRTQQVALISRLTLVEIRSLLARRLRAGDITAGYHRDHRDRRSSPGPRRRRALGFATVTFG